MNPEDSEAIVGQEEEKEKSEEGSGEAEENRKDRPFEVLKEKQEEVKLRRFCGALQHGFWVWAKQEMNMMMKKKKFSTFDFESTYRESRRAFLMAEAVRRS